MKLSAQLQEENLIGIQHIGSVVKAIGTSVYVKGLNATIGQTCRIVNPTDKSTLYATVTGYIENQIILCPLGSLQGLASNARVYLVETPSERPLNIDYLGKVLDGTGKVLSEHYSVNCNESASEQLDLPLGQSVPAAMSRAPIDTVCYTGVKAIDGFCTVGRGQRVAVFAPAGVGKSTLLGMIAEGTDADVIVIGLIGERGREVREFVEDTLGEEGLAKSVLVVSTSDEAPLFRIQAADTSTAIAEYYRDQGKNVLLLIDSVTRYARALREIGLSTGEPPVRRGYPPSVFAALPLLFERAGNNELGSITAFYTVLDDSNGTDPIVEEVKSILDGHILLSEEYASKGQFPAVDILGSISRLFPRLVDTSQLGQANRLRELIAKYKDIEFLIQVGEYEAGRDPKADEALATVPAMFEYLKQNGVNSQPLLEFRQDFCKL